MVSESEMDIYENNTIQPSDYSLLIKLLRCAIDENAASGGLSCKIFSTAHLPATVNRVVRCDARVRPRSGVEGHTSRSRVAATLIKTF